MHFSVFLEEKCFSVWFIGEKEILTDFSDENKSFA